MTVTVAVNCCVAEVCTVGDEGETVTEITEAVTAVTFTVVEADFVVSATLVAVTVTDPVVLGAVKSPALVIAPADAVQVTAWLAPPVTVTVAENCWVPPVWTVGLVGEMATAVTLPDVPAGAAGTRTVDAQLTFEEPSVL